MAVLNLGNFEIPDGNATEALAGILATKPNTEVIQDPEFPDDPDKTLPKYTDEEWLTACVWKFLNKTYRQGCRIIRDRDAIIIEDISVEE